MSQTEHCGSLHSGTEKTFKSLYLLAKDSEKNDLTRDNLSGNSYPTPAKTEENMPLPLKEVLGGGDNKHSIAPPLVSVGFNREQSFHLQSEAKGSVYPLATFT